MKKIGVGVIGCGKISQVRHLPEYAANANCRIVGVFDINLERAKSIADQYGAKAFSSVEELLAEKEIDAVSICSSNNSHASISIQALEAGKHVLCEKPMAITLNDCIKMVEAAERNGRYLMIGQNQRFAKAHVLAKKLIEEGRIGKILTFKTTFGHGGPETWSVDAGKNVWFFNKDLAGMGSLADLGVHKTDLIHFLTGQKVVSVSAMVATLDKKSQDGKLIGVDDNAICIYRLSSGAMGSMTSSWTYYSSEDNSTVLYGTEGVLRLYSDPQHSVILELKDGSVEFFDVDQIQTNDNQTKSGVIDSWIDSLVNEREPAVTGRDVLAAMKAVFGAIESSKTGKTVEIR